MFLKYDLMQVMVLAVLVIIISAVIRTYIVAVMMQSKAKRSGVPWICRNDWAKGEIVSKNIISVWWCWLCLFVLTFLAWRFLILPTIENHTRNESFLLYALLFGVDVVLIALIYHLSSTNRKFGRSVFKMNSLPGIIGGSLEGVVLIQNKTFQNDDFLVRLICFKYIMTRSGSERVASQLLQWTSESLIKEYAQEYGNRGVIIPVLFKIPSECSESGDITDSDRIIWRLQVQTTRSGLNYSANFDVPVFKHSSSNI